MKTRKRKNVEKKKLKEFAERKEMRETCPRGKKKLQMREEQDLHFWVLSLGARVCYVLVGNVML